MALYRNARGQVVAELVGNTLRKTAHGSRHMLRTPPAWAFDASILEAAERDGALYAEVLDLDTKTTYRTTLEDFRRHGLTVDRGYGRQTALPLAHWRAQRAEMPRQMELFA